MMKKYYNLFFGFFGLVALQSSLHSQSINLTSFQEIQALNVQECAVVQVNASWNYKNRVKIERLSKLCYIAEIDLSNKTIGAVIQKEWKVKVVPTIIILKEGKEVMRYEPGISMRFDEEEIFNKIRKQIK